MAVNLDSLKLSPENLKKISEQTAADLSRCLSRPLTEIQRLQREMVSQPGMSDPDNFSRKILIDQACHEFNARVVQGAHDITSCKTTSTSDGIRAVFACDHPLAEASIKDNLHITELQRKDNNPVRNIKGVTFRTGAVIFRDQTSGEHSGRARYISNEAAHQILNSETTEYHGAYYKNIFHFQARDTSGSSNTPKELVKLFDNRVPRHLSEGISFKDSSQVHELLSDCTSVNTSIYDLEAIIANSLGKQGTHKNCVHGYAQTNLFVAKQALKYLSSLPEAANEKERQIRGSAIVFLRARIKHGAFRNTPFINVNNEQIPAATFVCLALGDDGFKFLQSQYKQLGRSLVSAIVEYNTGNRDKI